MKLISGLAAVALAATTTIAATTIAAQPATAATPVPPTQLAGDWSAAELTNGLAVGQYGADVGLSIDAGLAFDALGRAVDADRVAEAIADRLVTSIDVPFGYVSSDEYDWNPPYDFVQVGHYANATAKAAAFVERLGRDAATTYPEVDLVDQLEDLTDDTGLIADDSSFGNYANTIGQAFAAEALTSAGSREAAAATRALLAQQCPAGYFRFDLAATACSVNAAGVAPDTTALAVLSLLESGNTTPEVTAAITAATDWLLSAQLADGSLDGDASAPGSNANSTGLAGWALGAAGHDGSAAKAAVWVRSMQVADAGACASRAPTGAIAYSPADLSAARAGGITGNPTVRDKWRRAAFQSMPVLRWAPVTPAPLTISTPATVLERTGVTATVRGLAAGEHACVSLGTDVRRVVGTGAELTVPFTLPGGAAAHTFTLATLAGATTSMTTSTTTSTATPVPSVPAQPAQLAQPLRPLAAKLKVSKVEKVRKNAFGVRLVCAGAEPCAGNVKVRTATKVKVAGLKKRKLVLVSERRHRLTGDSKQQVSLKLTRTAQVLVAERRLRVKAIVTGGGVRSVKTFWLKTARS